MEVSKRNKTIRTMATLSVLIALTIVFCFVQFSLLPNVPGFTVTFIIVAIGAVLLGPWAGAVLGLVFGLVSFGQAFIDPFGQILLAENVLLTFVVCVPTRVIMGLVVGLIYKAFRVKENKGAKFHIAHVVTSVSAPILNTLLFVGVFVGCFWNLPLVQNGIAGEGNLFLFIVAFVGLNFLLEVAVASSVGYLTSSKLTPVLRRYIDVYQNVVYLPKDRNGKSE